MSFASMRMRAILVNQAVPGGLGVHEVCRPHPSAHEALVRVAAVSLNGDELAEALMLRADGTRLGSDLAGTVEVAALDGSGPGVGARVAGLVRSGAWAEFVAVPSDTLAELPAKVSFAQAATLPAAGLTALYGLGYGGLLAAKRVLISCGVGGVGLYAVQLAHLSGARVTAVIHGPEHEALMEDYGADHVVAGDVAIASKFGPYHLVMAAAGGAVLGFAMDLLRTGGICLLYGTAEARAAAIDERAFVGRGVRLQGIGLFEELRREPASEGLQRLLALVTAHALQPHVEFEADWMEAGVVRQHFLGRSPVGSAVLRI